MVGKNYYEILEVDDAASSDEIKKAFRKMAVQFHPDSPGGNEVKFKEINEAYQTLSNDEKKAKYDFEKRQLESFNNIQDRIRRARAGAGKTSFDVRDPMKHINDIFVDFLSNPHTSGVPRRVPSSHESIPRQEHGDDVTTELTLSIEESMSGCKKTVKIVGPRPNIQCGSCSGNGSQPGTRRVMCPACSGKGSSRAFDFGSPSRTCSTCHGKCTIPLIPCQSCKGTGKTTYVREISVTVPAGIAEGQQLRIAGMGTPGHPPGDLYININISVSKDFRREGSDIHVTKSISLKHAILGGLICIEGPDGSVKEFEVPPGTQSEDILCIKGEGVTGPIGGISGDLIVHVHVQLPKVLSARGKKLLEEFSEELTRGVPESIS